MMTEWEKEAIFERTDANTFLFFNDTMTSIETYQENSENSSAKNGYASENTAIKISASLRGITQEQMGTKNDELEQAKTKHLLQMSTLRSANQPQDCDLKEMGHQLRTLIQALTTLTKKMDESSSSR